MISFTLKSKTNQEGVAYSVSKGFAGLWAWNCEDGDCSFERFETHAEVVKNAIAHFGQNYGPLAIEATLFKESGKYYCTDLWELPANTLGPFDMVNSPDFRRIGGGAVLINSQEPWGFPHLFPGEVA